MYGEALELFADVADDRRRQGRASMLNVAGRASEWQWEGMRHAGLFYQDFYRHLTATEAQGNEPLWSQPMFDSDLLGRDSSELPSFSPAAISDRKKGHRLEAVDRLRRHEQILRAGWMWLAGTVDDPVTGKPRVICCPLLSVPVAMSGLAPIAMNVKKVGDVQWHPLLADAGISERDLLPVPFSTVRSTVPTSNWVKLLPKMVATARAAASELGFSVDELLPSKSNPRGRRNKPGLALVPGVAVYVNPAQAGSGSGQLLRDWTRQPNVEQSAFSRLYESADQASRDTAPDNDRPPVRQTRPLNRDQKALVEMARTAPLLAVTGPPGTGKTHALCEVALDAIGQGKSVLIGAKSPFAVDVLARQLTAVEGPVPVLFGGSQSGAEFTSRMGDLLAMATHADRRANSDGVEHATVGLERAYRRVVERAQVETLIGELAVDPDRCRRLQNTLAAEPGLPDELAQFADTDFGRWLGSWRRRRRARELGLTSDDVMAEARIRYIELDAWRRLVRADAQRPGAGLYEVDTVDSHFHDQGLDTGLIAAAVAAEDHVWSANAQWLRSVMLQRLAQDRRGRQLLQQIATATRVGRSERRKVLEQLDAEALAEAAPLWLGTVGDIDGVLPFRAAMFDLLILDEASQIDQPSAAGALLRASSAVICGDPRQLRHLSFVGSKGRSSDGSIDIGRSSIFDQTVGVAPSVRLHEHYRSDPHLIDFSARRFYDNGLGVATRHPGNDGNDLIDVHVVQGVRADSGVNQVEIDAVLRLLREEPISDGGTIGIVTPFRAQADALTDAVIEHVHAAKIERRGIEVGTVHAFQGAEFDHVIASWAADDDSARAWTFLNDASLFNVMITRARKHMTVVTSVAKPPGLAGDYVRHGEQAIEPTGSSNGSRDRLSERWVDDVMSVLADAGFSTQRNYPVGRFVVDIVLRDAVDPGGRPTAICCWPSPDHLERELMLHRLGWNVIYAFRGEWSGRLARLAIELDNQLDPRSS